MKFSVLLTRTVAHSLRVTVDAANTTEAEEKAIDYAGDQDFSNGTSHEVEFDASEIKLISTEPATAATHGLCPELANIIAGMKRRDIVTLLEGHAGIQCYDSESDNLLREALRVNVADGTIDPDIIREMKQ